MSRPIRLTHTVVPCLAALALFFLSGCGVGPNVFWSPDGKSLALDLDGKLRVVNVQRGEWATLDTGGRKIANPIYSPDGGRIVYQAVTAPDEAHAIADLRVRDLRTNRESIAAARIAAEKIAPGESGEAGEKLAETLKNLPPAWSPDGRWLAFSRTDRDRCTLQIARAADGGRLSPAARRLEQTLAHEPGAQHHPAWSPDGTSIAYLSGGPETDLYLADGPAGKIRRASEGALRGKVCEFNAPVWSADGTRVVVFTVDNHPPGKVDTWAVPATGGRPHLLGSCTTPMATASADILVRAYIGGREGTSVVYRAGSQSRILDQLPEPSAGFPVLSVDGRQIALPIENPALKRQELRFYDVTNGKTVISPIGDGSLIRGTGAAARARLQRITELPPESPWHRPLPWALAGLALSIAAVATRMVARAWAQRGI
jgi:Tol biopolymer transport system component